ncbi:Proline-rich protein PRCC [Babesia duncani]|uniref:Proline-rich protein PRCC n=1 Tax=Babesia duncani TaxID=323732 RepID=A0AAD9PII0_9APIC|nr:Proline-rich protein PRCC [Babesia duncani]
MDWIKSALDSDDESQDENKIENSDKLDNQNQLNSSDTHINKTPASISNKIHKRINPVLDSKGSNYSEKLEKDKITELPQLFSFKGKHRETEKLDSNEFVKINVPTDVPDDLLEVNTSADLTNINPQESYRNDVKPNYDMVDYSQVIQSFNVSNANSTIKASKRREWQASDLSIKDIHADDLRMSKSEKITRYSSSKEALMEGREAFKLPTRLMETDDGELLTTNMIRRTQKRKHQINWLAQESHERELELLEASAQMRKTKHETQMKYGW